MTAMMCLDDEAAYICDAAIAMARATTDPRELQTIAKRCSRELSELDARRDREHELALAHAPLFRAIAQSHAPTRS